MSSTTTQGQSPSTSRPASAGRAAEATGRVRQRETWRLTRHFLEMVVAMLVGMGTLFPLWWWVTRGVADASWVHGTEVELLVMATAMTVPMVPWMWFRGHRARLTLEMAVVMYASFAVLLPLLWVGALDEMGVMMAAHVLMPLAMLGAMIARRREYVHHC